ncbi:MAG: hypothetical protein WCE62_13610 [Polyangiales bacterium]
MAVLGEDGVTMKQSPLLTFESSAFAAIAGEDLETNPAIFGKALALWLAEQLRTAGFRAGDVVAEDFGWCVPSERNPPLGSNSERLAKARGRGEAVTSRGRQARVR